MAWRPPRICPCLWRDVIKALLPFWNRVRYQVGSGADAAFWKDAWSGDAPLILVFPVLFAIEAPRKMVGARFF